MWADQRNGCGVMAAVKDIALVEQPNSLAVFERLATDPKMNVETLERLVQMHERAHARVAEEQFNAAMSKAQSEMRHIAADGYNPQTKSRYASYAAIDKGLRPIYTENGFGLSFDTEDSPLPAHMRVLCRVSHIAGHSRTYRVDMPADGKGAKGGDVMTLTHAAGAAMSYGMRYLVKMIFNVAVGEDDRDGNAPEPVPQAPDGYEAVMVKLEAAATEGKDAFAAAFHCLPEDVRDFAVKHDRKRLQDAKSKAHGKAVKS